MITLLQLTFSWWILARSISWYISVLRLGISFVNSPWYKSDCLHVMAVAPTGIKPVLTVFDAFLSSDNDVWCKVTFSWHTSKIGRLLNSLTFFVFTRGVLRLIIACRVLFFSAKPCKLEAQSLASSAQNLASCSAKACKFSAKPCKFFFQTPRK